MDESRKWERYGALGGIGFVVLLVASIIVGGSNPNAGDSAAKIVKYFHDNADSIKVSAFLGVLVAIPILWWAGSLWARLSRAEGGQPRLALVAVLGLVLGGASAAASNVIAATVVLERKDLGTSGTKFFFLLGQGSGAVAAIGFAVLVLATSVLALRTDAFPTWLGWVGIVDGLMLIVASYGVASTSGAFSAIGFFAFIIWAIWIISTSVIMFRAKEPASASQ